MDGPMFAPLCAAPPRHATDTSVGTAHDLFDHPIGGGGLDPGEGVVLGAETGEDVLLAGRPVHEDAPVLTERIRIGPGLKGRVRIGHVFHILIFSRASSNRPGSKSTARSCCRY